MTKPSAGTGSSATRNFTAAAFAALLFCFGVFAHRSIPPTVTPKIPKLSDLLTNDMITLVNPVRETTPGNETCVVVGCYTPNTAGVKPYWNYYRKSGYAATLYAFDRVMHKGKRASDKWCDVPTARDELRLRPNSRIIYIDIDTKIDVASWCDLPDHPAAPLVINSLTRGFSASVNAEFVVEGSQVQTNAFRVTPGKPGLDALRKWELNFYSGSLSDQGAIHLFENGLCGVPGWVACRNNPEQQTCHCFGSGDRPGKIRCIEKLFNGTSAKCKL